MTRKQLYKILKEHKLFSKFCIACAEAYAKSPGGKERFEAYIKDMCRDHNTASSIISLINGVKSWRLNSPKRSAVIQH